MSLLYAYYGDDFTGSTDVLEQLGSNGVPAVLFLGLPSERHLRAFSGMRAVGIAGEARSRSPEWMDENLAPILEQLNQYGAPIVHYKVCSTFDSSPERGSIGRAIEIGRRVFGHAPVPIAVGAPHLGRYVAFGNLFARDSDGKVHRIDRHSMSRHPTTPMHEADLRRHLSGQTAIKIGLVDLRAVEAGGISSSAAARSDDQAIVFDSTSDHHQRVLGQYFWEGGREGPQFYVGSSGLTHALVMAWRSSGEIASFGGGGKVNRAEPLLVVSGSCSPVTEGQLRYALAHGYHGVQLNPEELLTGGNSASAAALEEASQLLALGKNTVLYTAMGTPERAIGADRLGAALGELTRKLLKESRRRGQQIQRLLLCGGDTSSHAVKQLDGYALTWVANLQPGGPLCRLHADSDLEGLEIVLKGGQVGSQDFFDVVRGQ